MNLILFFLFNDKYLYSVSVFNYETTKQINDLVKIFMKFLEIK